MCWSRSSSPPHLEEWRGRRAIIIIVTTTIIITIVVVILMGCTSRIHLHLIRRRRSEDRNSVIIPMWSMCCYEKVLLVDVVLSLILVCSCNVLCCCCGVLCLTVDVHITSSKWGEIGRSYQHLVDCLKKGGCNNDPHVKRTFDVDNFDVISVQNK